MNAAGREDGARPVVVYVLRRYPQLSQTFVRNEVQALRACGVDVRVWSLRPGEHDLVDAASAGPVEVMPRRGPLGALSDLGWWAVHHPLRLVAFLRALVPLRGSDTWGTALRRVPAVARQLAGTPVAAFHTHFAWEGVAAVALMGRLLGAPASVTVHANDIYRALPRLARRLAALQQVVTVCEHNVRYLREHRLWTGPVPVVPCGVAPADAPPAGAVDARRLVTVGRLVPKKGVLTLVQAMAHVVREVPDAVLQVVGDGPQEPQVRALVDRLGLGSSVQLLGARPHAESLELISAAGVFVLACETDPDGDTDALPVVIREAMVRARPVVTTALAGIPEVVDATTGWVVPPASPALLAEALVEALTDRAEAAARGESARERTLATGTLDRTARGMLAVFGLQDRR